MIVIASAVFKPEPVVSAAISFDIANSLSENNEVVVLCPRPTRPLGYNFKSNYNYGYNFKVEIQDSYVYPKSSILGRLRESYSFGLALSKYIENNHENISVVYANVWPIFAQIFLAKSCYKYGIPLVLHVQDVYPESIFKKVPVVGDFFSKIFIPLDRYTLKKCASIITISNQVKRYLTVSRQISIDNIKLARNWQSDEEIFSQDVLDHSEVNSKFTFMYVGSVSPTANLKLVIIAFSLLNKNNARLVIAGSGTAKPECIDLAKKSSADISFIDVTPHEVPALQSCADVLILPLRKGVGATALPSKLTAYMFSGKPILAVVDTDCEAYDVVVSNGCGWGVEPDNLDCLVKCFSKIMQAPAEDLINMGASSLKYAKDNLSKEKNMSVIISEINFLKKERGFK